MFRSILGLLLFFVIIYAENVENVYTITDIQEMLKNAIFSDDIINSTCFTDIKDTLATGTQKIWPVKMMDSWSKIQSGIALGNIINLGSFDECLSINGETLTGRQITGKYCLYALFLEYIHRPEIFTLLPLGLQKYYNSFQGLPLIESLCVPNSCSAVDLNKIINSTSFADNLPINPIVIGNSCQSKSDTREFLVLHWITVIIFATTILLMIICTSWDIICNKTRKSCHKLLLTFSVYTNIKRLITVKPDPDQLSCINGIRFLSMMWVITGHKYLIVGPLPHTNYLDVVNWIQETSSYLVIGALFAVDSFFLISGLLVMYVVLLAKNKGFNFNLFHYYMHRIFRLSPALVMLILVYMTFLHGISSGPVWPFVEILMERPCTKYWWKSFFFIQNTSDFMDICVQQSWYLAVDTQLYVVAPLLFIPIKRLPTFTRIIIILLTLFSCIYGTMISWKLNINATIFDVLKTFPDLYANTLARMNAWLIGTLLGYFLFVNRGKKFVIRKSIVAVLWILSISVMLCMVLMFAYFAQNEYNRILAALHTGFSKAIWSICLSWIIFACIHGYGGVINEFLSHKVFIVLGRLTYTMFLLHIPIMYATTEKLQTSSDFSNINTLKQIPADFLAVLFASLIWSLAFESPIIAIGKILIPEDLVNKLKEIARENENSTEQQQESNNIQFNTHL